ncbi:hypothetical protein E2986_09106 [Frieseomelitta varia]|uniref:Ribosomal RNA-processing protein 42 n=1 Tax=Frieseomelitta varia TaxID=561572 RepID=A0A833W040_9HYME|nr:hypothetical protein E2986_09106 [Frieseomelitta varia]
MAETVLSSGEKIFILHGIDAILSFLQFCNYKADFRNDGRRRCEYRSMEIETKLMPQTHGSARLHIGNTDILVGIKVELDIPHADKPNEGKLEFFVDWYVILLMVIIVVIECLVFFINFQIIIFSATATPAFEGKGGDDLATEISNVLTAAYQTRNAFDLKTLCILPHKKCWKIYVDVLILQCGGNLFDAVGIAVKAALNSTEIPKITAATLDGGEPDIELSDDSYDCIQLDTNISKERNFVLYLKYEIYIGDNYIVDPTLEEEVCSTSSIVMSILPNGKISSVVKLGYGSIQFNTFTKMLQMGEIIGLKLNKTLMDVLKEETQFGRQRRIFGFLK